MKIKAMLAAAMVLTWGGSALAAPVSYQCEYKAHSRTGWVPEKALYQIDQEAGTATAYDGYIHYLGKKPISVDMRPARNGKFRLNYTLNGLPMQGNSTGVVSYSVFLDTGRGKSSLSVNVRGFDNEIRGTGKCALQK